MSDKISIKIGCPWPNSKSANADLYFVHCVTQVPMLEPEELLQAKNQSAKIADWFF